MVKEAAESIWILQIAKALKQIWDFVETEGELQKVTYLNLFSDQGMTPVE